MKLFYALIILALPLQFLAQENPKAKEIGEAIKLMDAGQFADSRLKLEEVLNEDPNNYDAWYEFAYSYYLQKDYKKAEEIMRKQTEHPQATDQLWQMIGNAIDFQGNPEGAIAAYAEGLKKFPNSGRLYVETGNIYLIQKNIPQAIQSYEKGIEMAPEFSSNYYRLAKIYCDSEDELWGLIYGELFMNLERNTKRTREMSLLLYQTYQKALVFDKGTIAVSFAKSMSPFSMEFEMQMGMAATKYLMNNKKVDLDVQTLLELRQAFLTNWQAAPKAAPYKVVLFDFWQQLNDVGFIEPYTYWLFNMAPDNQFEKWHKKHESDFTFFTKWYNPNPIQITAENYFSKQKVGNGSVIELGD
jgi:tetratricopeptide (TPR) repeat protein